MRTLVSDGGCLNGLRKASLLDAFLKLPYEILIPNTLFEDDLLKFTNAQKRALVSGGMKVTDLPGESVLRARQVVRDTPQLSIHDGFVFALAEGHGGCILLAASTHLFTLASSHHIDVQGLFWVIDEIHRNDFSTAKSLYEALLLLAEDNTESLPPHELSVYIRRYDNLR
jgi:hypothetical protein